MNAIYRRFIKRAFDLVIAAVSLVVLTPIFLVIALAVLIDNPGPVIFRQKRIGRDREGKIRYFNIYKYRSMKVDTPQNVPTHMLEHSEKCITRVGRVLRKTSLDELPQFVNILLGQMSVIGPRPALWNQTDLYEMRARYGANSALPGLTGWAQVHGRDELTIDEKARYDGYYCSHISLPLDCRCFLMTIVNVLGGKGVVEGAKRSGRTPPMA